MCGWVPENTPSIAYPENRYFGEVLSRAGTKFGTANDSVGPACVTAFSSGTKELVLQGIGVGWMPFSMVHKELASGELVSLANHYGREPLNVTILADSKTAAAVDLLEFWTR